MKKTVFAAFAATLSLALVGCISNVDTSSSRIQIRSFVDGCDVIKVKGDTVWYQHISYALPGTWGGFSEPTFVNGDAWQPNWTGADSDKYVIEDKDRALPAGRAFDKDTLKITSDPGLGRIFISEYPSEENDYTLVITVDDRTVEGASWYAFGIDWDDEEK